VARGEFQRKGEPTSSANRQSGSTMARAGAISFQVYTPVASAGQLAGIVYFDGGGWVFCNLDTHDAMCEGGAVSYRLIIVLHRNTSSPQPSTMPMQQPNGWRRMHPN
jgi:acetyl esterase